MVGTSYQPTEKDVANIKALLVEPTLRLEYIAHEIARLKRAIGKLVQESAELNAYVNTHKALIAPIRRLPLDVIQDIFVACMPTDRNCAMSAAEAPVLLGRVCSSWRALSMSTPRLWNKLHIVEPCCPSCNRGLFQGTAGMIKTWLDRSGELPLSISFHGTHKSIPTPLTRTFINALVQFSARWQHVRFTGADSVFNALERVQETDVPMLQSIRFSRDHTLPIVNNADWPNLRVLRGAQVSRFAVSLYDFSDRELPALRWDQITVLAIEPIPNTKNETCPTSQRMLEVLSHCPNIRVYKCVIDDHQLFQPPSHPTVDLPFLSTLDIVTWGSAASLFAGLLDRLTLPQLRDFALNGNSDWDRDLLGPEPDYTSFFSGFFSRVTRLENFHLRIDKSMWNSSILGILQHLPTTLTQLHLHDTNRNRWDHDKGRAVPASEFNNLAFGLLTPGPTADFPVICPRLQEITIDGLHLSDVVILQFIDARMAMHNPALRFVRILLVPKRMQDLASVLHRFVAAGLVIQFARRHSTQSGEEEERTVVGWTSWGGPDGW